MQLQMGKLRLTGFSDPGQDDLHGQAIPFKVWAGPSDLPSAPSFHFPGHPQGKETQGLSGNHLPVNFLYAQPIVIKTMPLLRWF